MSKSKSNILRNYKEIHQKIQSLNLKLNEKKLFRQSELEFDSLGVLFEKKTVVQDLEHVRLYAQ